MSEYLTRREVAELFKLPLSTIDYLVHTGQLPYSRIGRRSVRFSRKDLDKYFEERKGVPYKRGQ